MVLETEEARIKGPAHCLSGEEPFQTAVFWRRACVVGGDRNFLGQVLLRALVPLGRGSPSHHLIPLCEFQHMNLEGDTNIQPVAPPDYYR